MGMASSRRYGMQEITLVTTSNSSRWKAYRAASSSDITWEVNGISYNQIPGFDSHDSVPEFDLSSNTKNVDIKLKSNRGLTVFECSAYVWKNEPVRYSKVISVDISRNTALQRFGCAMNLITVLDVTQNIKLFFLDTRENPNLATIYVNQTQLDMINGVIPKLPNWWWTKDVHTQYVLKQ